MFFWNFKARFHYIVQTSFEVLFPLSPSSQILELQVCATILTSRFFYYHLYQLLKDVLYIYWCLPKWRRLTQDLFSQKLNTQKELMFFTVATRNRCQISNWMKYVKKGRFHNVFMYFPAVTPSHHGILSLFLAMHRKTYKIQ